MSCNALMVLLEIYRRGLSADALVKKSTFFADTLAEDISYLKSRKLIDCSKSDYWRTTDYGDEKVRAILTVMG